MQLTLHEFDLRLKNTFKTAHSQRDVQKIIIVELEQEGIKGYGEVTVNTYFNVTKEDILADLTKAKEFLQNKVLHTPEALHAEVKKLGIRSFPLCAIDEAAYDLYGKIYHITTHDYIGAAGRSPVMTDYTVGIASPDLMLDKMLALPWPIYKVKLGTPHDIEIVSTLRNHTDAVIRVDANCGWTADETIRNAVALNELGVELIEQPLDPKDWQGMKKVYEHSVLPIIADESCLVEDDVDRCAGYFHGINIKLTKCGGITAARRMIEKARSLNMSVMAGCMNESSVGISAVCQLAPLLDYIDADGTLLITNNPATGVEFDYGKIIYPKEYGSGVALKLS